MYMCAFEDPQMYTEGKAITYTHTNTFILYTHTAGQWLLFQHCVEHHSGPSVNYYYTLHHAVHNSRRHEFMPLWPTLLLGGMTNGNSQNSTNYLLCTE